MATIPDDFAYNFTNTVTVDADGGGDYIWLDVAISENLTDNTLIEVHDYTNTYHVSASHDTTGLEHFAIVGADPNNRPTVRPSPDEGTTWINTNPSDSDTTTHHQLYKDLIFDVWDREGKSTEEWLNLLLETHDATMIVNCDWVGYWPSNDAGAHGGTTDSAPANGGRMAGPIRARCNDAAGETIIRDCTIQLASNQTGEYPAGNSGINYGGGEAHTGLLTIENTHIEGMNQHGTYLSRGTGDVTLTGCTLKNNNGVSLRIGGGEGTYAEDCTIILDWANNTLDHYDGTGNYEAFYAGIFDGGGGNNFVGEGGAQMRNCEFQILSSTINGITYPIHGVHVDGGHGAATVEGCEFEVEASNMRSGAFEAWVPGSETNYNLSGNTPSTPHDVEVVGCTFHGSEIDTSPSGAGTLEAIVEIRDRDNSKVGSCGFTGGGANPSVAFEDCTGNKFWDSRDAREGGAATNNADVDTHEIVTTGTVDTTPPERHHVEVRSVGDEERVTYSFDAPGPIYETGFGFDRPGVTKSGDERLEVDATAGMTAFGVVASGGTDLWYTYGDPTNFSADDTSRVEVYVDGTLAFPTEEPTTEPTLNAWPVNDGRFNVLSGAFSQTAPPDKAAGTTITSYESGDITDWTAVANDKRDWSVMHAEMFDPQIAGGEGAPASAKLDQSTAINSGSPATTHSELSSALSSAGSGDVVWVDGNANIDMSNGRLTVPSGVTLASDRGQNGSAGGRLFNDDTNGAALDLNSNSRINGLVIDGPLVGEYEAFTQGGNYMGVELQGSGVTIDNCEIRHWQYAGIDCNGQSPDIEYCHVHSCSYGGLGYGIVVASGAHPTIDYCYFDWCRHAVAASSGSGGYTITNSYFGSKWIDHLVDHHGPTSGSSITIQDCTFDGTHHQRGDGQNASYGDTPAIYIRDDGVVDDGLLIERCHFAHLAAPVYNGSESEALYITDGGSNGSWEDANVTLSNNAYGPDVTDTAIGAPLAPGGGIVHDGDYALMAHRDATAFVVSHSGLNAYPAQGDTFETWLYIEPPEPIGDDAVDVFLNLIFCQQTVDQNNCYELEIDQRASQTNHVALQKDDAGTDSEFDTQNATLNAGEWYRIEVELADTGAGEMTINIAFDDSSGTEIASLTGVDSSSPFTSGGIGVYKNIDNAVFIDDWTILP